LIALWAVVFYTDRWVVAVLDRIPSMPHVGPHRFFRFTAAMALALSLLSLRFGWSFIRNRSSKSRLELFAFAVGAAISIVACHVFFAGQWGATVELFRLFVHGSFSDLIDGAHHGI
jgi:hypothetical protein